MRKYLIGIMLAIVSCGPPHKFDDIAGDRANTAREYLSDRNISSEHAQDFWQDTQDYVGERANSARDYMYQRGICNMRHGRHCNGPSPTRPSDGSDGSPGSNGYDGSDGSNGNSGNGGSNGSDGSDGTDGSNGTDGTDGVAGSTGSSGPAGATGPAGSPGLNGSNSKALGPDPVYLGLAYGFTILSKSGITNVPGSTIVGDIGTSPITGASVVALDCIEVTGKIYTVDAAGPACRSTNPLYLTRSISDMEAAYTDAAGRTLPDATELGAGEIGGLTIAPGLYKWGTTVNISTNVTLKGGPNDVWIFQISGDLLQASATRINLEGGARAENIFWQVAGSATIFTTAHFEGTILSQTLVSLLTGATMNGRLLAQTAVTLQSNIINRQK